MSTAVAPAPPAAAQPPAEVARARIAVLVATYQVDVVVPTRFTIETFIDDLLAVLAAAIDDETVDFTPPRGQWSLARPGEPPLPRWRSLADHDITDGAVLALTPVESAEIFTPVVEDITDALARINEREFSEFDPATAQLAGLAALVAGAGAVAALLSISWTGTGSVLWCALPALLLGLGCWGGALAARRGAAGPRLAPGLVFAALPLLFAGGAMLVPPAYDQPGPFAAANLAAGGVLVAVAAVAALRFVATGAAALVAVAVAGAVGTVAALVSAYTGLRVAQVSAGVVFAGIVLLTAAPRLAVVIARIRPPDLPDPGTEVAPTTLTDIFDTETGRPPDDPDENRSGTAEAGIEHRARTAVTALRGLIAAVAAVLAVASVLTTAAVAGGIRETVLAAAVAGILTLRSRWFPDRVQALALLTAAALTVAGTGIRLAAVYRTPAADLVVGVLLAALACAGCVAALRLPGKRLSPVTRRVIDLVEYALILVVPIVACWIMGIYTAMRSL